MEFGNLIACADATSNFIGLFDLSIAPSLLYYSYIPIIFVSIFFSFFIFLKGGRNTAGKLLIWLSILFSIFLLNEIVQWVAVHANIVHFAWAIALLLQQIIFMIAVFFIAHFTLGLEFNYKVISVFLVLLLPTFLLLPTTLNLAAFEIDNCESLIGGLWYYLYLLEILSIIAIGIIGLFSLHQNVKLRIQNILLIIGSVFFLGLFAFSNIFGEVTQVYEINLIGPLGMLFFIGFLSYMIVKFKTFNIKLIATQALVSALLILIVSILAVRSIENVRIIVSLTSIIVLVLGIQLVRNVKREIEAKEKIEKLAGELQIANEGQANLIHIINHQIKGYLAKARNVFSELLTEPEYEPISESAKPMMNEGLRSLTEGVDFVTDFLNASNIEKGTYKYEMQQFDMKTFVQSMVEKQKNTAEGKGLSFELRVDEGDYNMRGDKIQLGQAVRNLIDNSIRYTPKGSVKLQLTLLRQGSAGQAINNKKILFKIEDTGVGISDKLKPKLFTKGGRDENSLKVNINSTGFGLSFVKGVVEAHRGRVWVESAGVNKGSTFFMELPVSFN